jgi:hypothetical protein
MFEREPSEMSCTHQLQALLRDPDFQKLVNLITREVRRFWHVCDEVARGFVLPAISEPVTLAWIYKTWSKAKESGESLGSAKAQIRQHVIDLLRQDMMRANHGSPLTVAVAAGTETTPGAPHDPVKRPPRTHVRLRQTIRVIRMRRRGGHYGDRRIRCAVLAAK